MRRRVAARVASISALALLLAGVVLCPARCVAGETAAKASSPPCHHAADDAPASHDGGLPPVAHATCCVVAVASPAATAPAPVTTSLVVPVEVLPLAPAALMSARVDARIDGRAGPPPTPLYLRLRTLLV